MNKSNSGLNTYKLGNVRLQATSSIPKMPAAPLPIYELYVDKSNNNSDNNKEDRAMKRTIADSSKNNSLVVSIKNGNSQPFNKHPFSNTKYSPIKIPNGTEYKIQYKKTYKQAKYEWTKGNTRYEVRWHTKTPKTPNSKQSWRASKTIIDPVRKTKTKYHLSGNKWIHQNDWKKAIDAKKNGRLSTKQRKMLDNAHFTRDKMKKRGEKK